MDTIIYNGGHPPLDLSTESLCIRAGFIMGTMVHSFGNAGSHWHFKAMLEDKRQSFESKIAMMKSSPEHLGEGDAEEMLKAMQMLWKNRRNTPSLLLFKKMEHRLNEAYAYYGQQMLAQMSRFSLLQLQDVGDDALMVSDGWMQNGESYPDGFHVSHLLMMQPLPEFGMNGPFALFLFDRTAALPEEELRQMTRLFTLPNLNFLKAEQLQALRNGLRPEMERLEALLLPTGDADGSVRWDKQALVRSLPELQRVLDANKELQWIRSFNLDDMAVEVLAGEMDTKRIWQVQRDSGIIPDDTWAKLQALPADAHYPQTIPVFLIRRSNDQGTPVLRNMTEETAMMHTRKTISLD
jgi:hypothetical protein